MATPTDEELDKVPRRDRDMIERLEEGEARDTIACAIVAQRRTDRLAVGDPAPKLELARLGKDERVALDEFVDDRPLVLVFGSFT